MSHSFPDDWSPEQLDVAADVMRIASSMLREIGRYGLANVMAEISSLARLDATRVRLNAHAGYSVLAPASELRPESMLSDHRPQPR